MTENELLTFIHGSLTELMTKVSAEFEQRETTFRSADPAALEAVAAQAAASSVATWLAIRATLTQRSD
ncbi:MAG TPA: hypothetical protein VJN18_25100 [Polyangiaceae bacterium]|nr:hypothetical protein [Polyangiaceae bacterium]